MTTSTSRAITSRGTTSRAGAGPDRGDLAAFLVDCAEVTSVSDAPGLASYADPYSFDDGAGLAPPAAVLPRTVAQVQEVVRAAARHGVSVWPVSTGRNLGYGGSAARADCTVVLDLHLMDAVLEVDVAAGTAVLEPGVTFLDLHEHLRSRGLPLWTSVPDIGWGSVVGNALERGFGYTAYGDHAAHRCGVEAVLADGTLLRTGMGAVPGGAGFAQYRGGSGPSLDGLFQQSNLGVVTKMGVWLMPQPDLAAACTVSVDDEGALAVLVDALHPLMLDDTIPGTVMIGNALAAASGVAPRTAWYDGPGLMPADAVRSVMDRLGIGWWNARFGLYGNAAMVGARLATVRARVEEVPGARISVREYPGDVGFEAAHPADRALLGIPSLDLLQMAGWLGGEPAHTDFSLVCPPDGATAARQVELVKGMVEAAGFDHAGGVTMFKRHAIALTLLSFDRSAPGQRRAVADLYPRLIEAGRARGWAPYRSHLAHMDTVAEQYSAGDHALLRTQRAIKAALDPAGTIAPGKQGV